MQTIYVEPICLLFESLHVNDQKRLIYQLNQLILQTFKLIFHPTMQFGIFELFWLT